MTSASTRPDRYMYMMSAGIAIINPTAVVSSARPIPAASSSDVPIAALVAIVLNDSIIPTTLPNRPSYGATVDATKHGFKGNSRTPMALQGCESCHGPGEAHASDPEKVKPVQFDKVSAKAANGQCTKYSE